MSKIASIAIARPLPCLASELGHFGIVRELLKHKLLDTNAKDVDWKTAVILATQKGHVKIVSEVLKHKMTRVNEKTDGGCTALILASKTGRVEV